MREITQFQISRGLHPPKHPLEIWNVAFRCHAERWTHRTPIYVGSIRFRHDKWQREEMSVGGYQQTLRACTRKASAKTSSAWIVIVVMILILLQVIHSMNHFRSEVKRERHIPFYTNYSY
ncbi:MAG: hypothetical protein IKZ46_17435 [Victivallales bacterium]|nr:hypothetical protein [Victivallales bacterium]